MILRRQAVLGLSHVPSHSTGIPSPRGRLSRDSCLQPEPTAACFGNSRSLADTHREPVSLNTGKLAAQADAEDTYTQDFAIPAPRFARKFFNLESSLSCRRSLSAELHG